VDKKARLGVQVNVTLHMQPAIRVPQSRPVSHASCCCPLTLYGLSPRYNSSQGKKATVTQQRKQLAITVKKDHLAWPVPVFSQEVLLCCQHKVKPRAL
jgi:hypothetical protein